MNATVARIGGCIRCSIRHLDRLPLSTSARHHSTKATRPSIASNQPIWDGRLVVCRRHFSAIGRRRGEQSAQQQTSDDTIRENLLQEQIQQSKKNVDPEVVVRLAREEFGDELPDGILSDEELRIYTRLYGEPKPFMEETIEEEPQDELQQRDRQGQWASITERLQGANFEYDIVEEENELDEEQDEADEYLEEDASDSDYVRIHPFTLASRGGTKPATITFPTGLIKPITKMLGASGTSRQHTQNAQKVFGGPGLPYSPSTPSNSRTMPQKPVPLSTRQSRLTDSEADAFMFGVYPHAYASITNILVEVRKRLGAGWLRGLLSKPGGPVVLDTGAAGAGILAWREILRAEWETMQDEKDEEVSASKDFFDIESEQQFEPVPLGKATVVVGSETLRQRASRILDSTTFIPRLPDPVPAVQPETATPRKQYDVIIAPYSLWRIEKEYERKYMVQTLWSLLNPDGGVIILLEKGVPRGFEVIAGAREHILKRHIKNSNLLEAASTKVASATTSDPETTKKPAASSVETIGPLGDEASLAKEPGTIIAPCTNHSACPLYKTSGISQGRKDYCKFSQKYFRPQFLQSVLQAKRHNFDNVEFSYVAVQRGVDLRQASGFSSPLLIGNEATDRAFKGYGDEEYQTVTQEINRHKGKEHAAALDDTVFGDMEALTAAAPDITPAKPLLGDPPHPLTLPRLLLPALKRKGHVVLDVCTPSGTFERWLVNRRNGKRTYRDARKSQWGDLWALGAKSRETRRINVGEPAKKTKQNAKSKKRVKRHELLDALEDAGLLNED